MIIALNNKKTVLITSLGLCFLGTLYAALRIYYKSKSKKKTASNNSNTKSKLANGSANHRPSRPNSLNYEKTSVANSCRTSKSTGSLSIRKDKHAVATSSSNDVKNLPAEELLELGLNYLNQAIRSWETALDSIESAAYMQSQTLALPSNEHANIVYTLRNLVDMASNINLNCGSKLVKSSQTLQIIQSRLAYKQQLYAEALLKNNQKSNHETITTNGINIEKKDENDDEKIVRSESASSYRTINTPLTGSYKKNYGYLSDDDNESFVSADSDVDWLTEEMFKNIEHVDEKNVLYEMALSNVSLGRVAYRVSRCEMLNCKSEEDFGAKLHVIRLGFDRLLQDNAKRQWMIEEGKQLLANFLIKCDKDCNGFTKSYDELIRFSTNENNWKNIKDELATRSVNTINFYDIVLDFILLDAFEDLENPPSAVTAVIQNSWLSQSFKETALATAVWSVLKAKRKMLKYQDGFITRFYSITEYLVPVLAWGFLGTDEDLKKSCNFLKNHIVEYLKCLFDVNRTRYTNLDELAKDIESHTIKYLKEISENI